MSENTILVEEYCCLVNKILLFLEKHFESVVPAGRPDEAVYWRTKEVYDVLENCDWSSACRIISEYLAFARDYFEQSNPGDNGNQDRHICRNAVLTSVQMIANLTIWLDVLGVESAKQVKALLQLDDKW